MKQRFQKLWAHPRYRYVLIAVPVLLIVLITGQLWYAQHSVDQFRQQGRATQDAIAKFSLDTKPAEIRQVIDDSQLLQYVPLATVYSDYRLARAQSDQLAYCLDLLRLDNILREDQQFLQDVSDSYGKSDAGYVDLVQAEIDFNAKFDQLGRPLVNREAYRELGQASGDSSRKVKSAIEASDDNLATKPLKAYMTHELDRAIGTFDRLVQAAEDIDEDSLSVEMNLRHEGPTHRENFAINHMGLMVTMYYRLSYAALLAGYVADNDLFDAEQAFDSDALARRMVDFNLYMLNDLAPSEDTANYTSHLALNNYLIFDTLQIVDRSNISGESRDTLQTLLNRLQAENNSLQITGVDQQTNMHARPGYIFTKNYPELLKNYEAAVTSNPDYADVIGGLSDLLLADLSATSHLGGPTSKLETQTKECLALRQDIVEVTNRTAEIMNRIDTAQTDADEAAALEKEMIELETNGYELINKSRECETRWNALLNDFATMIDDFDAVREQFVDTVSKTRAALR